MEELVQAQTCYCLIDPTGWAIMSTPFLFYVIARLKKIFPQTLRASRPSRLKTHYPFKLSKTISPYFLLFRSGKDGEKSTLITNLKEQCNSFVRSLKRETCYINSGRLGSTLMKGAKHEEKRKIHRCFIGAFRNGFARAASR
jgi:hypothetical protein